MSIAESAALLAPTIALFGLLWERHASTVALKADLILRINDRFNSDQFRRVRRAASAYLIDKQGGSLADVKIVLEFFEEMGLLLRKKALDKEMIWSMYAVFIWHYWYAAAGVVNEDRIGDPLSWDEYEYLLKKIKKVEFKKNSDSYFGDSNLKKYIDRFLSGESNI